MHPKPTPPDLTVSQIQHFWTHVERTDPTADWLWTGTRTRNGYGDWRTGPRQPHLMAHRLAYYLTTGEWPADDLHHLCGIRHCVNPTHLQPIDRGAHTRHHDPSKAKREATHCKRGHAYAEHGYTYPSGHRGCKLCHNLTQRTKWRETHPVKPPRTTCRRGHPCTPENQYIDKRGYPICRPCKNLSPRK